MLYVDQGAAPECFVTQLGASKAGVTVHTFAESEGKEALAHVLNASRAKGLIFSPATSAGEGKNRANIVQNLLPELEHHYSGDELKFAKFSSLKHVVQTGFTALRGVNYFKDFMVYAVPKIHSHQIPTNNADDQAH